MRMKDISDEDFDRLIWYARFLKNTSEDFMNMHSIDVGELEITEDRLIKMREENQEIYDGKYLLRAIEFVKKNEIKAIECDQRNQREAEELEKNHPVKFDEDGYAYREFKDDIGMYRNYGICEMGN